MIWITVFLQVHHIAKDIIYLVLQIEIYPRNMDL